MGGDARLSHVVDDDGGVLCLRVLQEVLEKRSFACSEEAAQLSHGNGIFGLLAERLVGGCYAR